MTAAEAVNKIADRMRAERNAGHISQAVWDLFRSIVLSETGIILAD